MAQTKGRKALGFPPLGACHGANLNAAYLQAFRLAMAFSALALLSYILVPTSMLILPSGLLVGNHAFVALGILFNIEARSVPWRHWRERQQQKPSRLAMAFSALAWLS